jgi:hypothetical protein
MTALYVIALIAGVLALLIWIAATSVAASVDGWQAVDPERRFGRPGRLIVAGLTSFGLAGMSASYAGWSAVLAALAAVLGAAVGVVSARLLGPAD